jgi:isopropylmalate/homocitrate/citramalate synthase
MNEPWKSDRWYTSPWNYAPNVREGFHFPAKIKVHDVTLRDGEQQSGVAYSRADKVAIAKKLAEAGVHRIEAGLPVVSPEDEAAVKEIASLGLSSEIFSFARCMPVDVKTAVDCGVKGIITEIPSSQHLIEKAYGRTLDWAIKASIETTLAAKEAGLYTVFFTIDSTRCEMDRYLDLIEKISTEGHMDALAVADSFGGVHTQGVAEAVRRIRARFDKPVEIHCHEDFGIGVANSIAALAAGASVVHTTVTGLGERAGNVPMEDVVLALLTMYGVDMGIRTEKFYELSQFVQSLSGFKVPPNRPIVGEALFRIESGIVAMFHRRCKNTDPLEYIPFVPGLVGRPGPEVVLGKGSGLASVAEHLERRGLEASSAEQERILAEVKRKGIEKKGLLTEKEFDQIVASVVQHAGTTAAQPAR